jgi:hypothetical protein
LLAPVDAGRAATIVATRPQAHFGNDHDAISSLRNDVELAAAAAVVARENGQVLGLQEAGGGGFGRAAGLQAVDGTARRQRAADCVAGSEGWREPSLLTRAQLRLRSTRPSGVMFRRPVRPSRGQFLAPLRTASARVAAS